MHHHYRYYQIPKGGEQRLETFLHVVQAGHAGSLTPEPTLLSTNVSTN